MQCYSETINMTQKRQRMSKSICRQDSWTLKAGFAPPNGDLQSYIIVHGDFRSMIGRPETLGCSPEDFDIVRPAPLVSVLR